MRFFPTVLFTAAGADPGAFLTAARNTGLSIRRFHKETDACVGEMPASHYARAARLARKNGVRLRVRERRGLLLRIRRYRKRLGLFCGLVLFVGVLLFSQCFLWAIDVTPTAMVTEQQVRDVLKSHGVKTGTFLPCVDLRLIALQARTELPGLSFLALNRIGSRIQVELVDAVPPPPHISNEGSCNVVASRTGIVRSLEVYRGQTMVKVNQSVHEGDLLVGGVVENADGRTSYQHARAKILAETRTERTFSLALRQTVREETGVVKNRYRVDFFGKKLPLFLAFPEKEPYESRFQLFEPQLGALTLPIGIEREERRFYRTETTNFTETEALGLLEGMARRYEEELGVEILGREPSAKIVDGTMTLHIVYTLLEDIAREKPFDRFEEP